MCLLCVVYCVIWELLLVIKVGINVSVFLSARITKESRTICPVASITTAVSEVKWWWWAFNSSSEDAEAHGTLSLQPPWSIEQIPEQSGLHRRNLAQKQKTNNKKKTKTHCNTLWFYRQFIKCDIKKCIWICCVSDTSCPKQRRKVIDTHECLLKLKKILKVRKYSCAAVHAHQRNLNTWPIS